LRDLRELLGQNDVHVSLTGYGCSGSGLQPSLIRQQAGIVSDGKSAIRSKAQGCHESDRSVIGQQSAELSCVRPQRVASAEEAPLIHFRSAAQVKRGRFRGEVGDARLARNDARGTKGESSRSINVIRGHDLANGGAFLEWQQPREEDGFPSLQVRRSRLNQRCLSAAGRE